MSDKFIHPLFYSDLFTKPNVGTEEQRKVLLDKINYLKNLMLELKNKEKIY